MDVVMVIEACLEGQESCDHRGFNQQISKTKSNSWWVLMLNVETNWIFLHLEVNRYTYKKQKQLTESFQNADLALTC